MGVTDSTGQFTITRNAGESNLYGAELSANLTLMDSLLIYAEGAYTNTEFDDFTTGSDDFSGNEFPFAPEWSGSIGATYELITDLLLDINLNYQDETFIDAANSPDKNDSFTLLNASLNYSQDHWYVGLYVHNITDEDYITRNLGLSLVGTPLPDEIGPPRTYGIRAGIRF